MRKRSPWFHLSIVLGLAMVLGACGSDDATSSLGEVSSPIDSSTSAPTTDPTSTETTSDSGDTDAGGPDATDAAIDGSAEFSTDAALDPALRWTVVAVADGDVLNVRSGPSTADPVIGTLQPWSTAVVNPEIATVGDAVWRSVTTDGGDGWANARFLVAQPETIPTGELSAHTTALVEWLIEPTASKPDPAWLAPRALWVGGVGVYGDWTTPWTWFPGDELDDATGWQATRLFEFEDGSPCNDCERSIRTFLTVEALGEDWTIEADDDAADWAGWTHWSDGLGAAFPPELHRVVLVEPATPFVGDDGQLNAGSDWQRLHFVFDWSAGEPRIAMINTHGWTP